jgi:hypothetical protein
MRSSSFFVGGFETSGERGPPPSPFFGSHGAGVGGFCVLSGMANTTDFEVGKQIKAVKASGFLLTGRFPEAAEFSEGKSGVLGKLAPLPHSRITGSAEPVTARGWPTLSPGF